MILWLGGAVEGLEQSTPVSIFEAKSVNTNFVSCKTLCAYVNGRENIGL